MTRAEIIARLEARRCTLSAGFAFRTDQELEQAYLEWVQRRSPQRVCITMSQLPNGKTSIILTALEV